MKASYIFSSEVNLFPIAKWFSEKGIDIETIVIEDYREWNRLVDNTSVVTVSFFDAVSRYKSGKTDCFIINTRDCMDCSMSDYLRLTRNGVKEEDIYFVPVELYYEEDTEEGLMTLKSLTYTQHMEFHTTHRCNLNCGGCNHFVPLISKDCNIDFERMIQDLRKLREKIHHISDISVLGGEPLASVHLLDYCRELRRLWRYAGICIYTNGLLIKKVDPVMLAEITMLNIPLRISAYPNSGEDYEDILNYCNAKNIAVTYEVKDGMYPPLHKAEDRKFPAKNTEMCKWLTVEEGRLYPCPMITYVKHFNKHFGENYPEEQGLDLYDDSLTAYEINQWTSKVHPLCNYCNEYPERGRNAGWLTNPMIVYGDDIKPKEEWWVSDLSK